MLFVETPETGLGFFIPPPVLAVDMQETGLGFFGPVSKLAMETPETGLDSAFSRSAPSVRVVTSVLPDNADAEDCRLPDLLHSLSTLEPGIGGMGGLSHLTFSQSIVSVAAVLADNPDHLESSDASPTPFSSAILLSRMARRQLSILTTLQVGASKEDIVCKRM